MARQAIKRGCGGGGNCRFWSGKGLARWLVGRWGRYHLRDGWKDGEVLQDANSEREWYGKIRLGSDGLLDA